MSTNIYGTPLGATVRPYAGPVSALPFTVDLDIAGDVYTTLTVEQAEAFAAELIAAATEARTRAAEFEQRQTTGANPCLDRVRTALAQGTALGRTVRATVTYRRREAPYVSTRIGRVEIEGETVRVSFHHDVQEISIFDVLDVTNIGYVGGGAPDLTQFVPA